MVINEWKIAAGTVNVSDVAEKRGALVNQAVLQARGHAEAIRLQADATSTRRS